MSIMLGIVAGDDGSQRFLPYGPRIARLTLATVVKLASYPPSSSSAEIDCGIRAGSARTSRSIVFLRLTRRIGP